MTVKIIGANPAEPMEADPETVGLMQQGYDDLRDAYIKQRRWLWIAGGVAGVFALGWVVTAVARRKH